MIRPKDLRKRRIARKQSESEIVAHHEIPPAAWWP